MHWKGAYVITEIFFLLQYNITYELIYHVETITLNNQFEET